jgi:hypothetical protein
MPKTKDITIKAEDKLKEINKLVSAMLHSEPMTVFTDPGPKSEFEHEQKASLAKMYADRGFRTYLQEAVNRSIKASAMYSDDLISLVYNKSRIILLKELLQAAEKAFKDIDATMARARINANNESR